jgi:exosortase
MLDIQDQLPKGSPKVKPRLERRRIRRPEVSRPQKPTELAQPSTTDPRPVHSAQAKLGLAGVCLGAATWAYWPTILDLVGTWNREPDYSHGFLVVPVAIAFLWLRRASFPGLGGSSPGLGLALLAASLTLRYLGGRYYMSFMDGWSIVPWAAAAVAILGGRPLLLWCLPSIGFLVFMVPLPFRLEAELSAPLQRVATKLSSTILQLLGQPAFPEGNVILLGEDRLEVAQACSGLRLFMSTLALTYVYLAATRRVWWEKSLLALGAIPIAIFSNSVRIVVTGVVYRMSESEETRHLAHDWAGWGMIVLAGGLFSLLLWYLGKLTREVEVMDMASLVRQAQAKPS